ncbi:unnamed protein product [Phytomonas sp. Hart1]|nr:unnamed protein product [Phytomonas sp. Hart1]|eukprot:CCW68586.1 unnamed protein product [Phytomonas sp. isolate Hart1]
MVDKVQHLLSAMDGDTYSLDVPHSGPTSTPSASPTQPSAHSTRVKIEFLYSDEDNVQPHDFNTSTGSLTGTSTHATRAHIGPSLPSTLHTRVVPCPDPLEPDAETLMELQTDAQNACDGNDTVIDGCEYAEDVVGTMAESLPGPSILSTISPVEDALASAGIRARVVSVTPHGLNMGDHMAQGSISEPEKPPLRRGLTAKEFARFQGRRHLRSDSDEDDGEGNSASSSLKNKKIRTKDIHREGETEESGLEAIFNEDGSTVRAIRNGPYCLTVDERDLIENDQGHEEATAFCEKDDANSFDDAAIDILPNASEDENYLNDDDDDSDADCELDECLVVAVVEQLVRCCESEDLDQNMQREASRFLGVAKPLLTQLENETISLNTFSHLVDRDLHRFHRIFKSVYRPRDEPIVIDGVQMDL